MEGSREFMVFVVVAELFGMHEGQNRRSRSGKCYVNIRGCQSFKASALERWRDITNQKGALRARICICICHELGTRMRCSDGVINL